MVILLLMWLRSLQILVLGLVSCLFLSLETYSIFSLIWVFYHFTIIIRGVIYFYPVFLELMSFRSGKYCWILWISPVYSVLFLNLLLFRYWIPWTGFLTFPLSLLFPILYFCSTFKVGTCLNFTFQSFYWVLKFYIFFNFQKLQNVFK